MTPNEITITVVASIFGLVLTILNILQFFRNDKKDSKSEVKEIAAMQTDLGYIKDGIGELKSMMQRQSEEQNEMKLKVQKIEDRVESIESRMESLEKRKVSLKAKGAKTK